MHQPSSTVARPLDAPGAPDAGLQTLRRVRTVTRLRRAGLSRAALSTLLPDWYASIEQFTDGTDVPIVLALGDA